MVGILIVMVSIIADIGPIYPCYLGCHLALTPAYFRVLGEGGMG